MLPWSTGRLAVSLPAAAAVAAAVPLPAAALLQ